MSIPPLVCSTPPPPEQCEDDKDQEDYDLSYNLSQEDDGNDYDYNNYSSFNHFQSTTTLKTSIEIDKVQEGNKHIESDKANEANIEINNIKPNENTSAGVLEDDIIEDLNLQIDNEHTVSIQKHLNEESEENICEKTPEPLKSLHSDIPSNSTDSAVDSNAFELRNEDLEIVNVVSTEETEALSNSNEEFQTPPVEFGITEDSNNDTVIKTCDNKTVEEIVYPDCIDAETANNSQELPEVGEKIMQKITEDADLDEFGDFDDFQFVSSDDKKSENILSPETENPWQDDTAKDDDFGNFTANFGEEQNSTNKHTSENISQEQQYNSEDDFGDFDEFKAVNDIKLSETPPESYEDVPVLNLQSSDSENQMIERINSVIYSIFQEEITECNDAIESKLDSSLGETWGHLRETDVRQPYIVNWNNSLAQKTLLKALCIDSRNILFGPKWGSNMPKYAATLSAAPLQPQKQTGQPSLSQNETTNPEKAVNKNWSDPFTADGQESCHTERENTVIEAGPTDLDVFEAAMSSKPDKIYSNTLGIQPIRQINLPDTHIFTPTNSEIPRSKTIHYDDTSTPTVLMPQSAPDNISSQTQRQDNDNDYWEFQDFRGSSDEKSESSINIETKAQTTESKVNQDTTNKSNITLATQVLQPIKLEPIMPTLNWPDPGEVKETFEDFSDFMSNSPITKESQEAPSQPSTTITNVPFVSKQAEIKEPFKNTSNVNEKLDDDFDMFQSATLPSIKNTSADATNKGDSDSKNQATSSQILPSKMTDFDIVFSKIDKVNSENISFNTKPTENSLKKVENPPSMFQMQPAPSTTIKLPHTNVLQPTQATPTSTKQAQPKMGQILQPLSLESYSQINWPNPGIDLQDLSRFNPVESLQSLKNESNSKTASPIHNHKNFTNSNQISDEDIWGEFVSSKPKQQQMAPKKQTTFADDDEWTDFVSSPSVNPQNGLNTISLNVHTNSSMQKSSNSSKYPLKSNEISLDIPALNYITPKSNKNYNERHFQNL